MPRTKKNEPAGTGVGLEPATRRLFLLADLTMEGT